MPTTMSFRRLLPLLTFLSLAATTHAAVTLVGSPQIASDNATTGHTTFANVSVQAGDYVVLSTASNKNFTQNQLTYSWSGAEGVAGTSTSLSSQQSFAAYLSYTAITTTGTYDFSVLAANSTLTANSALYILRPDTGEMILVADTDSQAVAAASGTSSSLAYLFSSALTSGFAIEAATTQSGGAFTLDSDYLTPNTTAASNGRLLGYSSLVSGSSWSSTHPFATTPGDIASVGAVFTTTAVPEPSRCLLFLAGLLPVALRRRR